MVVLTRPSQTGARRGQFVIACWRCRGSGGYPGTYSPSCRGSRGRVMTSRGLTYRGHISEKPWGACESVCGGHAHQNSASVRSESCWRGGGVRQLCAGHDGFHGQNPTRVPCPVPTPSCASRSIGRRGCSSSCLQTSQTKTSQASGKRNPQHGRQ